MESFKGNRIYTTSKIYILQCYERKLNQVHDHYFGNGTTEKDRKVQYVNLISDMNMVYPIDKAAKMHATHSATFYYE